MPEQSLPTWYTELAPEVQAQITSFLQMKGREIAQLKRRNAELETKVSDRDRIIAHRNEDVTRLQSEVNRLARELEIRPKVNRTTDQLFAELLDWYNAVDLFVFRIKAIGEKYLPDEIKPVAAISEGERGGEG